MKELSKKVVSYYRKNIYFSGDNILEWNKHNKNEILHKLKEKFPDEDLKVLEMILENYYSEF